MAKKKRQSDRTPATRPARDAAPEAPSMDVWDRIAWACLHILVVLVPIAMSNFGPFSPNGIPLTFDQFDIVKVFFERALMLTALGAWAIGILGRGGTFRSVRGMWPLLAFLAWLVLTSVLSLHPATAVFGKYRRFEGLLSFFTYAATFFVVLQYATSAARVRSLARSLAVGGFLVAFYGALQVVGTVSLGVGQVLYPLMLVLTVAVPAALAYLALARLGGDREARLACWIGVAIALVGGVILSAGLSQNLDLSLAQGLDYVSVDPIRWGRLPFETNRAFSTFGNPDLLGGYLIFPFAVALGLAITEKHPVWRAVYWTFSLFNIFVGITSYVRGAWIGATVALICLVLAYWRARSGTSMRLRRVDQLFMGGAGFVAATVVVASSLRPDVVRNVLTRVGSIFQFGQGSALTRFQIWEAARAAIAEEPLFGWGADTFRLIFPMFKPAEYVEAAGYLSVADNVHNYPLQLASGIGIPGALLFYGLVVGVLVLTARIAFSKGTAERGLLFAAFWAAVVGYVVHLMFGLSVTGSTIMMWLAMGVLAAPLATEKPVRTPAWNSVAVAAVTVVVLLGLMLNYRFILADVHYLKGRIVTQGADRVQEIERSIELNPYNDMYRLELGRAWSDLFIAGAAQYAQEVAAGQDDSELRAQVLQLYDLADTAYQDMLAYSPTEYDTYVFLSSLHNQAATYIDPSYASSAAEVAEAGAEVEPFGPAVRVQAATAYEIMGRNEDAIAALQVATELDSNFLTAWTQLATLYARVGRYDDAEAAYAHVLERSPEDAGALQGMEELQALEASAAAGTL